VLIAAMVLIALVQLADERPVQLTAGLAELVLVVAIWALVLNVTRHVRGEQTQRLESADLWRQVGACAAADSIQDRVANSLALTVGYAEFLADDGRLPADARDQAQRSLEAARRAARAVAEFKQGLGCDAQVRALSRAPVPSLRSAPPATHAPDSAGS
jgi:hypothetical protein